MAKPGYFANLWPGNLEYVSDDVISPYPCQTCKTSFTSRHKLATHHCDPYGRNPKPVTRLGKLEAAQVLEIRERAAKGEKNSELAIAYGVSETAIGRVVLRKSWKNI